MDKSQSKNIPWEPHGGHPFGRIRDLKGQGGARQKGHLVCQEVGQQRWAKLIMASFHGECGGLNHG